MTAKSHLFKSFLWDFSSRFSNQLIGFVVSIFLTRFLKPEEFGIMGIALVMMALTAVFVDMGFGKAIIQQQNVSESQLATIFYLNFGISCLFALLCFFLASPLSIFFRQPLVEPVVKTISPAFIFYGLNVVPTALLYRRMKFKALSIISVIAVAASGGVGIYMAINGYGVWSLVVQTLILSGLTLFATFIYLGWWPILSFVPTGIKTMWKYSSRLFASSILDTIFTRVDIIMIGRMFSPAALGYYTRAQSLDGVVKQLSGGSLLAVLFPHLSREQENTEKIRGLYIQYLHIISFTAFFICGFLYLNAESIFTILFTDKWLQAAYLFKIITLAGFVYPVSALMVNILSSRGNSIGYFRAEVLKKLILIPAYIIGVFLGLDGFAYAISGAYIIALGVNIFFVEKEIQVSFRHQLQVVFSYGFISALIVLALAMVAYFLPIKNIWGVFFLNSLVFSILYLFINAMAGMNAYRFLNKKIRLLFVK